MATPIIASVRRPVLRALSVDDEASTDMPVFKGLSHFKELWGLVVTK